MQSPDVIRRWWPGFGECRITVSPLQPSAPGSARGSIVARAFACVPRLFSRIGLGSLSFTVDPAWILQEGQPPAVPLVLQFLRVHRQALAGEWKSRQGAQPVPAPPMPNFMVMPVRQELSSGTHAAAGMPRLQGEKGLPSWFGLYCATGEATKPKPESREEKPVRPRIEIPAKRVSPVGK